MHSEAVLREVLIFANRRESTLIGSSPNCDNHKEFNDDSYGYRYSLYYFASAVFARISITNIFMYVVVLT